MCVCAYAGVCVCVWVCGCVLFEKNDYVYILNDTKIEIIKIFPFILIKPCYSKTKITAHSFSN